MEDDHVALRREQGYNVSVPPFVREAIRATPNSEFQTEGAAEIATPLAGREN
jgi:hypothetical protein